MGRMLRAKTSTAKKSGNGNWTSCPSCTSAHPWQPQALPRYRPPHGHHLTGWVPTSQAGYPPQTPGTHLMGRAQAVQMSLATATSLPACGGSLTHPHAGTIGLRCSRSGGCTRRPRCMLRRSPEKQAGGVYVQPAHRVDSLPLRSTSAPTVVTFSAFTSLPRPLALALITLPPFLPFLPFLPSLPSLPSLPLFGEPRFFAFLPFLPRLPFLPSFRSLPSSPSFPSRPSPPLHARLSHRHNCLCNERLEGG